MDTICASGECAFIDDSYRHLAVECLTKQQSEWQVMSLQKLQKVIRSTEGLRGVLLRGMELEILHAQGRSLSLRLYPEQPQYRFNDLELMQQWLQRVARVTVYLPWKCTEHDQVDAIFPV